MVKIKSLNIDKDPVLKANRSLNRVTKLPWTLQSKSVMWLEISLVYSIFISPSYKSEWIHCKITRNKRETKRFICSSFLMERWFSNVHEDLHKNNAIKNRKHKQKRPDKKEITKRSYHPGAASLNVSRGRYNRKWILKYPCIWIEFWSSLSEADSKSIPSSLNSISIHGETLIFFMISDQKMILRDWNST